MIEDSALQVILKSNGEHRLLGRITSIDASKYSARMVTYQLDTGERDEGMEIMTSATFVINHMNIELKRRDAENRTPLAISIAALVPFYAQVIKDLKNDSTRYTWPAVIIGNNLQTELLFDHPDFEPV